MHLRCNVARGRSISPWTGICIVTSQPFHRVTCVRLARDCSPTGPRENSCRNQLFLRPACVSVADDETLKVIDSLPYAASGDRKKIDKIIELLEKHCLQDVNILFERHRFYRRVQKDGESINKICQRASNARKNVRVYRGRQGFY